MVHRAKYNDWSLPKGKLEDGEDFETAALREIAEETSLSCRLGHEIDSVSYLDRKSRSKLVRYWVMWPVTGSVSDHVPDKEITEVRWVSATEAQALLTYERDRVLVERAVETVP